MLSTHFRLVMVALLWGGTFIAGRQLGESTPPLLSAFIRFCLASLALALYLRFSKPSPAPRLKLRQLRDVFVLGATGIFLYNLCFFYGLQETSASRASLIVAMNPAVIALAAALFNKDHITNQKMLGIGACLAGSMSIILSKTPADASGSAASSMAGDLLILGCVASWVTYSVYSRRLIAEIGPLKAVYYSVLAGTLLLLLTGLGLGQINTQNLSNLNWNAWGSLTYLGVLGSAAAYVWYYRGIEQIGATRSGIYIALVPFFAVLMGYSLLGEEIRLPMILGGISVTVGILLCNSGSSHRSSRTGQLANQATSPD